jgi:hypothetical protein
MQYTVSSRKPTCTLMLASTSSQTTGTRNEELCEFRNAINQIITAPAEDVNFEHSSWKGTLGPTGIIAEKVSRCFKHYARLCTHNVAPVSKPASVFGPALILGRRFRPERGVGLKACLPSTAFTTFVLCGFLMRCPRLLRLFPAMSNGSEEQGCYTGVSRRARNTGRA